MAIQFTESRFFPESGRRVGYFLHSIYRPSEGHCLDRGSRPLAQTTVALSKNSPAMKQALFNTPRLPPNLAWRNPQRGVWLVTWSVNHPHVNILALRQLYKTNYGPRRTSCFKPPLPTPPFPSRLERSKQAVNLWRAVSSPLGLSWLK